MLKHFSFSTQRKKTKLQVDPLFYYILTCNFSRRSAISRRFEGNLKPDRGGGGENVTSRAFMTSDTIADV
jgi:hypothetical protein